jgi:hypothetical protein
MQSHYSVIKILEDKDINRQICLFEMNNQRQMFTNNKPKILILIRVS